MIPGTHASGWLAAYLDKALSPEQHRQVEEHLSACERCRAECEAVRSGIALMTALPREAPPNSLWPSIQQAVDRPERIQPVHWRIAAAVLLAASAALVYWMLQPRLPYELLHADGTATGVRRTAHRVETDAGSRARLSIGSIGTVDLAPNTSVRVLAAKPGEHRLALTNGILHATIEAPPRMFFVETPAGTAIDLGCEYTLECGRNGDGLLQVTRGWVSYEARGTVSLVPAGALCWTRANHGPGTPVFADAPEPLLSALQRWDFEAGGDASLSGILAHARLRDTLTLWHLLARSTPAQRSRIYERMIALSPPPAGVAKEDVLRLEPAALERWKAELAWQW